MTNVDVGLVELSHTIARAIAERDRETLDAILLDDFVHLAAGVAPSLPQDKRAFLTAISEASFDIIDIELSALQVRFADDVAVVVGIQTARVELSDQSRLTSTSSFTDVFRRRGDDGRWRLWLAHSTEMSA